jgi:glycolate dehydrogenase FAD-linked subunit
MKYSRGTIKKSTAKLALCLAQQIGEHNVIDDRDLLEQYAGDESHCDPVMPDLVVRVRTETDVVKTLTESARFDVPVTPRGGGTGKVGGAIPIYGGIVLDTSRMKDLVEIDDKDLFAVVEPGMVTGHFHTMAEDMGLFYPPDPNSWETCCLGGNVAHNAGGPRAFKYGVTREYVMGLDLALIGGQRLSVGRRTIKCVSGYDLTGLLVGSEGTLGVFTKLRLRLIRKPPTIATLLVRFNDEVAAGRAVSRIIEGGLVPRVMEFMDGVLVKTLRESGAGGIPTDTGALLLAEVDGSDESVVESEAERFAQACEDVGAIDVLMARHGGERDKLWAARRMLSDAIGKQSAFKISEDIAVPRSRAGELLEELRIIGDRYGVVVASYGHAGDGNYHVNVLWDDPDFDAVPAVEDVLRIALKLGGTITGEHGIGLAKKQYLHWERDTAQLELQKALKRQFDPKGLMNPGKIF